MLKLFRRSLSDSKRLALGGLLLAMVTANTTPLFSKSLYDRGWTPMSTYFLALLIMTIFLAVHELMAIERGARWGMDRHDVIGTLLTTLVGGILSPLCFFLGLQYVLASEAVLLTSMMPLFIVVFAMMFLGERGSMTLFAGGALLLTGLAVLLLPDIGDARFSTGAPLLIASSFFGALTTIFHKKFVKHRHLDSIVLVRSALSLVVFGIIMLIFEPSSFSLIASPQNLWLVLGLPLIGFLAPFFLYFHALRSVKAVEAGFIAAFGPVAGVLMASVFRGEQLLPHQFLSLAFIVAGIVVINVPLTRLRIVPSRLPFEGPLRK